MAARAVKDVLEDLTEFPVGMVVRHGEREVRLVQSEGGAFAAEGRRAESAEAWKQIAGGFKTIHAARQAAVDWLKQQSS